MQFQKIFILPPQKGLEFSQGWGFCKTKNFKEMYEAQLEFPEGWGVLEKKSLPWGRYGYFLVLHNDLEVLFPARLVVVVVVV